MNLDELIKDLKVMPFNMRTGALIGLYTKANEYMRKFEQKSPVDTSEYRSSWRMSKGYQNKIAVKLYNEDPKAESMEFGANYDEAPWYFPKGQSRSKSGKLYNKGGKVWAGGINPGRPKTFGGAIDPIIYDNGPEQNRLARVIADNIIKRIK